MTLFHDVVLESPRWLLLLLAVPALFWIGLRSLGDFTRRQLALQAILRTLVLAGIALALARPALRRDATQVSAVALVDVSDSISAAAVETERSLIRDLERAAARRAGAGAGLGRPLPLRVVRFAQRPEEVGGVEVGRPAGEVLARFPAAGGAGTDLALAMGLGAGLFDPAGVPRMLIVSDGAATSGDAAAEAERLAARGVRVDVHTLRAAAGEGDVAVDGLTAPEQVRPHAPFELTIRLVADRPGTARLRLERDGRPNEPEAERTVEVAAGETAVNWTTRIDEPGTALYRARIVAAAHDAHAENDRGVLAIATERDPRVLYLEGDLSAAPSFAAALEAEKITVDVRGARGLPGRAELDRYDLVVLSDVPRSALGERQMDVLDGFVRDGGGLLMAGGAASFGSGGYEGSRLEALLPVRLDLPEKTDEAMLALALVIDRSGSMSGPKMELTKEAARATAEMLPPSDQIAVIVFDNQAVPVVRMQRAANRARILADISRIQASGGTEIMAGLREGVDALLSVRARKKHIILLSDGQSTHEGIADLLDSATGAQITVSAVGVGEGADLPLLQMIASRGGGRFYHTRDPASIPRIFTRETSEIGRSSLIEAPTAVRVSKRAELLGGLSLETAPRLRGYAMTRPRPQADLILTTGTGDPLLARWQVGLGQVAAWTSDVKARWSADWLRWPGFPKFWGQVARTTMRRRAANHFPLRAALEGESVTVAVDAIGADDRFMTGLEGSLQILTATADETRPPAAPRTVALAERAPGRYEATFTVDRGDARQGAGALLLKATLMRGTALVADATGRLGVPLAPELRPRPVVGPGGAPPSDVLAAIAARTGGSELADVTRLLDPGSDRRTTLEPLRTPVLLVTLALFLLDVLARRVRLDTFLRRQRGKV